MSDYQAIYDAVQSKIHGGNIGDVIRDVAQSAFDISWTRSIIEQEMIAAIHCHAQPSAIYRPSLSIDGNQWCALYGDDLQNGVAGFGNSPSEAMADFDKNWRAPSAGVTAPPETQIVTSHALPVTMWDRIATAVVKRVAELPDRTSPDDRPDAMLVTGEELHRIIMSEFDTEIG